MKLTFEQSVSPECLELMWSAFFAERNRGRSLVEHFPWLTDLRRTRAWLATLRDDRAQAVACLAVKRHFDHVDTASIGLVCVRADLRGQGLSQSLLANAIRQACALGMTRLTLWTGKPAVYVRHGFQTRDPALFGWVRNTSVSASPATVAGRRIAWPDSEESQGSNRGLPPFAVEAYRLIDGLDRAQAVIVVDRSGPIVAEWSGDDVDVAHLLRAELPPTWRLNALRGDTLPAALQAGGVDVDLAESGLQMWQTGAVAAIAQTPLPRLRFLDRI